MSEKFNLYGFNNLTKSLSFNIYDVCYAKSQREQKDYIAYIDQQYNSERLTKLLVDVTEIPGVRSGDAAVIIGRSGQREISVYDWAEASKTITNEVLSRLGPRLVRVMV